MSPHPEHDRLQAYLDGELPADEIGALEARLKREPELADELLPPGPRRRDHARVGGQHRRGRSDSGRSRA